MTYRGRLRFISTSCVCSLVPKSLPFQFPFSYLKYQRQPDEALVRLPPVKSNSTMQDIETLDSNRRPIPLISPASSPNLDTKCKVQAVLRWPATVKVAIRHFHVTIAGIARVEGGDESMDNHVGAKKYNKK